MCNSTTPAGQLGLTDANHECHCGSANPAHTISARPEGSIESDYLVDGMTCQHCVASVSEEVSEIAGVTGLVMTKLDGTARGGVLVAAAEQYRLPIHAIGVGEKIDDLRPFNPDLLARVIVGIAG